MSRQFSTFFFGVVLFFIAIMGSYSFSSAQLCTGSLGDPVVNITFGSGSSPNINFTAPGYTYTASSCPNDGYYTITNFSTGCFNNAWHTVATDHTGNGNYMLVNASYQPGDFFVASVSNLCPNTTYEFSAWIMNVLLSASGIKPDITFRIETPSGTILNQYNTGGIFVTAQPRWDQYGFYFTTTPGNPTIVLRMTNNAPGGGGNDLALDDITFRPCGPVLNSVVLGNGDKIDVCVYDQVNYSFSSDVSAGFVSPVFQWQESHDSGRTWIDISGATNSIYLRQPTPAGNYWYRQTVAESGNAGISSCRIASNILVVNAHAKPSVNAGPDRTLVTGYNNTTLAGVISGDNVTFNWLPPDYLSNDTILNPLVTADRDIIYTLSAVSQYGCSNEDQVMVKVVAGVFVPTAFTPNNDGKNDNWTIPYLDPSWGASVNVFNRYGQLVYHVTGSTVNWNGIFKGILQPPGTYVYFIHFKDGKPDLKGTVNLIR